MAWLAGGALAACAAGDAGDAGPSVTTDLTVWNRSNYQLLELRIHDGPSYQEASNLLASPLVCEQQIDITATTGQYVTVIR
ncbi:MAG: hypothetical protein HYZ27_05030, partial [Deltaproteobacteria bacterium]|nr:hypothetical protein [Deltaproteobacteria bacterium]